MVNVGMVPGRRGFAPQRAACQKEAPPPPGAFPACCWRKGRGLKFQFGAPVVQPDDFLYFAAFVPVFLGLGRSLLALAEGVFGVADGFVNQVQRFRHTAFFF